MGQQEQEEEEEEEEEEITGRGRKTHLLLAFFQTADRMEAGTDGSKEGR